MRMSKPPHGMNGIQFWAEIALAKKDRRASKEYGRILSKVVKLCAGNGLAGNEELN